ncbi:uncharacterized protein N7525_000303 [Penicillium rubens]|uniref:uncharacterized protein n=1 Tax=Penicillium rubens TaxID=1108849 RepID=UPI002A5A119D|nr:uncharacterized protein N7525_000303 [Penicillium rubens]KAJ5842562.1 hypothetical protein N7525_000303 [Penicillium rubens]KAJ5846865.1 hypothetical protein N7534_010534 [Penicillium rubens]
MPKKKGCAAKIVKKPSWIPVSPDLSRDRVIQNNLPGKELLYALASLRLHSKYSDISLTCGNTIYTVYKCIVCTRSEFFAKACSSGFKRMIDYLYSLDYRVKGCLSGSSHDILEETSTVNDSGSPTVFTAKPIPYIAESGADEDSLGRPVEPIEDLIAEIDPLSFHILIYSLADRMFIVGLEAISKAKVERELLRRLDANTFQSAIVEIYNSTPASDRGLRDLAVEITLYHLRELRTSKERADFAFPSWRDPCHNLRLICLPQ